MVKNIKIKFFFVASFTWILILMLMLGSASIFFTRRLASQTINFYESPHTIQLEVAEIRNSIRKLSSTIREELIHKTKDATRDATPVVSECLADMNERISVVNSLFTGDGSLLTTADNALNIWLLKIEELRVLLESQDYEQAIRLFESDYLNAESAVETSVLKISDAAGQTTMGYYEAAKRSKRISVKVIISVVLLSIVSTIAACTSILRSITIPLLRIREAADAMAHGDLKQHVDFEGTNEFGQLAKSMNLTVETLSGYVTNISDVLSRLSNNDMTVQVDRDYIGDLAPIKVSLLQITNALNSAMTEISQCANLVAEGAGQVSDSSQTLAQGAAEQAESSHNLSANLEHISMQVRETAKYSEETNELVEQVAAQLEHGNQQMGEMLAAMGQINDASNQIAKIIRAIEEIAFQTNILALNAAVEAARAGDAGKGFAVVADEVRSLAGKSAEAANSTTSLIQNTIRAVENGTKIADSTAHTLDSVVSGARSITDMIAKLTDTAKKQAVSLEQVSDALDTISLVIQSNSAASEECAASSEEMSSQAQTLRNLVSRYKLSE